MPRIVTLITVRSNTSERIQALARLHKSQSLAYASFQFLRKSSHILMLVLGLGRMLKSPVKFLSSFAVELVLALTQLLRTSPYRQVEGLFTEVNITFQTLLAATFNRSKFKILLTKSSSSHQSGQLPTLLQVHQNLPPTRTLSEATPKFY